MRLFDRRVRIDPDGGGSVQVGACLIFVVASACATSAAHSVTADLGAVPPALARVCIVRPSSVAANTTMEVRDNGRLVAATRGRTYACWMAAPGEHQIRSVDDDTGPTFFHARAGRHYWLHQDVSTLGSELHAHLDWIDEEAATEMLRSCETRVRLAVPDYDDTIAGDALAVTPKL